MLQLWWRRGRVAHCGRETLWLGSGPNSIVCRRRVTLDLRVWRRGESIWSGSCMWCLTLRPLQHTLSLLIRILHRERMLKIRLMGMNTAGWKSWSCGRSRRRSNRRPIHRLLSRLRLRLTALSRMLLLR
jgi:hypothetical protein